jgi:hypothetical protein
MYIYINDIKIRVYGSITIKELMSIDIVILKAINQLERM